MEEDEPLPYTKAEPYTADSLRDNSPYAIPDHLKSGLRVSDANLDTSDSGQTSNGSSGYDSPQTNITKKPPVPGNKPSLRGRPHSVHGNVIPEAYYPNGTIVTQIRDQDGFRTTRMPINGSFTQKKNYTDESQKSGRNGSLDGMHVYNARYATLNGSTNQYREDKLMDSNQNTPVRSIQRNNSFARYSHYTDHSNGEAVQVKNILNKNSIVTENNEKTGSLSSISNTLVSPNGNSSFPSSVPNKQGPEKESRNGREEVSTEL